LQKSVRAGNLVAMPLNGVSLILDLGIVVAGAAIASIVFRLLKLPVIFGYLAVGLIIGNAFQPNPIIGNMEGVVQISELGVVFLLFFIGMEFDISRLRSVLTPAFMAVAAQTVAMLYLSRLVSPLLGWGYLNSLFFGCLLAISSSMVTLRVLQEQKRDKMAHAQLATGIMILEDVMAILLLVILSGVSVSRNFDWHAVWLVTFLMGVFTIAVFFFGRILAPKVFEHAQGNENREALTIISVGLLLGIGALALRLHFSGALGAFVAGAILSKTKIVKPVLENNRAFRDLFCAIFFVSIGMQIDPKMIWAHIWIILAISFLMIVGKIASCFLGMFLAGQSPETSYNAAATKAQIGEFSFIIAALGTQLGVTGTGGNASLTAITFGIAFVSILLTPAISFTSFSQYKWLAEHAPRQLSKFSKFYRNYLDTSLSVIGQNKLMRIVKAPLIKMLAYFFVTSGIIIGGAFIARWISRLHIASPILWGLAVWICTAILAVPFVIAIIRNTSSILFMITDSIFDKYSAHSLMKGRVSNLVNTLATLLILLVLGGFFLSVASPYLPRGSALALFLLLLLGIGFFFWRKMVSINSRIEALFIDSFAEDANSEDNSARLDNVEKLLNAYPWPVEVREVAIGKSSSACGKSLRELNLPSRTGSMVVAIVRGGMEVFDPSPEIPIFPDDKIVLLGDNGGNERAFAMLSEKPGNSPFEATSGSLKIERVILPHRSSLAGYTLAESCLRRHYGVSVVGIQRGSLQITSPGAYELLKTGDMLLFVGNDKHVDAFKQFIDGDGANAVPKPADEIPPATENAPIS
jgi:monovalent cation:H+ antiporter-2, CPA2 family